jgi:hypothetical protein
MENNMASGVYITVPSPHRAGHDLGFFHRCQIPHNLVQHEGPHELETRVGDLDQKGGQQAELVAAPDGGQHKATGLAILGPLHLFSTQWVLFSGCDQTAEEAEELGVDVGGLEGVGGLE